MTTAVRIDQLCINTIRTLAIDAVQKADSGHPGLPLGAAPMGYVLWQNHMRHDPGSPTWPDRDRFVLSAGHGSMLLYALLYLTGYDLTLEDLRDFRQWGSRTPGHPESFVTPGVEATTGPLGQGFGNAVGMAMAERALAHRFNRPGHVVVDHHTYGLVSDGDLMEGVAAEAASIAGQLKLGKIVFLYDANDVTLDGPASWSFSTEDVKKRFEAYGWQVLGVDDGDHDIDAIDSAIGEARQDTSRPSLIIVHTTIGYGSPAKQGKSAAHGAPLGVDEVAATKKALGWDPGKEFYVPDDVMAHFRLARENGARWSGEWNDRFESYRRAFPDLASEWERRFRRELPSGWDQAIPTFEPGKKLATREASGKVLNAIAKRVPELIGGDADLSSSTKTALDDEGSFDGQTGAGRNIHFGVREHAMGAIVNGFAYHGGLRPYASTFFVFSDYMRPAVRLAALSGLPAIYVWTHDSVGVGEDGPTHQPVEHLASLRAMPNLQVIRPADGSETSEAWRYAMERTEGPTALVLTRQKVTEADHRRLGAASGLRRGAYVLSSPEGGPVQAIVIATGSEVEVALAAEAELAREGVRVRIVSMPCWELFEAESADYREEVLPSSVTARVSVEAGARFGWSRFVGPDGIAIGIDRFGASAPGETNLQKLGITAEAVVRAVKSLL
ncbi:MAG TPA: transketolase [Vicinamibacteria bacterium]|nr:transketolase [Vicinamibacteria bacterium]